MQKNALLIAILLVLPAVAVNVSETAPDGATVTSLEVADATEKSLPDTSGDDVEYWALLVAVGTYANNPDMDRPTMLVEVERLRKTLLISEHWQDDHIKVITEENATVVNILAGFRWLDRMEDENDICLVYLTTHGFPILWDLPPFDEEDGMDEALACYRGFLGLENPWSWEPLANPFGILTDDIINFHLNRLETQGLCVIVDSCHSGGFNDNWSYAKRPAEVDVAFELGTDLQARNRIIMTSVPEEETSYGSTFTHYLVEAMQGYGDADGDGQVTAEEMFAYAEPIITEYTSMRPQLFDDYPGELRLAEAEFPPTAPSIDGPVVGKSGVEQTYYLLSDDPEGDAVRYHVAWGDGTEETTGWQTAGVPVSVTHRWEIEGTCDMQVQAFDERGAESDWSYLTVTMADEHPVDQRQVERYWVWRVNDTRHLAQSFRPSLPTVSQVEVCLYAWDGDFDVTVALRDALNGPDIATATRHIEPTSDWSDQWTIFSFEPVTVVPGDEYVIVVKAQQDGYGMGWVTADDNVYDAGTYYYSHDAGSSWETRTVDAAFVTYG
jgi:hypothetical protein